MIVLVIQKDTQIAVMVVSHLDLELHRMHEEPVNILVFAHLQVYASQSVQYVCYLAYYQMI